MTHYRIVKRADNGLYEVESWVWYWPWWSPVHLPGRKYNWWRAMTKAEEFVGHCQRGGLKDDVVKTFPPKGE